MSATSTVEERIYPWISILPQDEMKKLKKENEILSLITMLMNVTLDTIALYKKNAYAHLDALVGNYGCEVHAFNILALAHSKDLEEECLTMQTTCEEIQRLIRKRRALSNTTKETSPFEFYIQLQEESKLSQRMMYLIQSRLLTLTKTFKHDATQYDQRDYERLITVPNKLRKMCKLGVQDSVLNAIVSAAQTNMSHSSILFMRETLHKLIIANGDEGLLLKKMMSDENIFSYAPGSEFGKGCKDNSKGCKTYSCSYYNTKAVLMLLAELHAPLIIKKMTKIGEPVKHFAFKSCGEFGKFELMTQEEIADCTPKTPVIVCVAYLPDGMSDKEWLSKVEEYGLGNMILANASQESQYVPHHPDLFPVKEPEAAEEIKFQSEVKAQEIECVRMKGIFDLDHFYCSSWEHRGENIGENKP